MGGKEESGRQRRRVEGREGEWRAEKGEVERKEGRKGKKEGEGMEGRRWDRDRREGGERGREEGEGKKDDKNRT